MIKSSVDVIRAAAAEQRGFAAQIIDPPKLKTKFLEAAADLERAADRLAALERLTALLPPRHVPQFDEKGHLVGEGPGYSNFVANDY